MLSQKSASIREATLLLRDCQREFLYPKRKELDQCPATINTVLERASLLLATVPTSASEFLFLGDDDLVSVVLAVWAPQVGITVVDLDGELLKFIARKSRGMVKTARLDVREGLTGDLTGRFDTVFTDPPYTLAGQLLFLHRAMIAAAAVDGALIYLATSRFYLSETAIEQIIRFGRAGGFRLVAVREDFNEYIAPEDVLKDLRKAGIAKARVMFYSSLFEFRRDKVMPVPSLPHGIEACIYDYE